MPANYDLLSPGSYYHLYNRAIGSELMFRNDDNYRFFLQKIINHISPIASFYAYSLVPNHFHFLISIHEYEVIALQYGETKSKEFPKDIVPVSEFLMERFSNCFNAYTKSFNSAHNRKGKLFMDHLHRRQVQGDAYFTKVIHYIHANAVHHGLVSEMQFWPYSSYPAFLSNAPTIIERQHVLDWFDGKERFIQFHQQPVELKL